MNLKSGFLSTNIIPNFIWQVKSVVRTVLIDEILFYYRPFILKFVITYNTMLIMIIGSCDGRGFQCCVGLHRDDGGVTTDCL